MFLLISGFLFLRCSSFKGEQGRELSWERLIIEIPPHCLNTYVTQAVNYPYYYGYNYQSHAIDVFDLEKKEYRHSILLAREGPNGVIDISGLAVVADTLFVVINIKEVTLLDNTGKKLRTVWLSDLKQSNGLTAAILPKNDLVFISAKEGVVIPLRFPADYSLPGFYDYPILGYINLIDSTLSTYDFYYPEVYRKNFYGDFSYLNLAFQEDELVLSFPVERKFYTMKLSTGSFIEHGDSRVVTQPIAPHDFADTEKRINYLYDQKYYSKAVPLATKQGLFARVFIYDYSDNTPLRRLELIDYHGVTVYTTELAENLAINLFSCKNKVYFNVLGYSESHLVFKYLVFE